MKNQNQDLLLPGLRNALEDTTTQDPEQLNQNYQGHCEILKSRFPDQSGEWYGYWALRLALLGNEQEVKVSFYGKHLAEPESITLTVTPDYGC